MTATDQPAHRIVTTRLEDRALREERRELVATMLLAKVHYRAMVDQIRQHLNLETSIGTISNDVAVIRERWKQRMSESFESHVAEQMAYYDGLLRAVAPKALSGDHNAVQDTLGIMDRRAKLLRIDAPERILVANVTTQVTALEPLDEQEQIARTDQILAILSSAGVLPSGNGKASGNGHDPDAIDV